MNKGYIDEVVAGLKEYAGSERLRDILYALNIKIEAVPPEYVLLQGSPACYRKTLEGIEVIYLSDAVTEEEKEFIVGHELGHAVLHSETGLVYYSPFQKLGPLEAEADYFAVRLLNLSPERVQGFTVQDYSALCGVREAAVKYLFD